VQGTGRGSRHRRSTDSHYRLGQRTIDRRGGAVVPAQLHPRAAAPGAMVVAMEALASGAGSLRGRGRGGAGGVVLVVGGPGSAAVAATAAGAATAQLSSHERPVDLVHRVVAEGGGGGHHCSGHVALLEEEIEKQKENLKKNKEIKSI